MNNLAVVFGLISVTGRTLATDYCLAHLCYSGARHIACGNKKKFDKRCSSDASIVNMNNNLIEHILNLHNTKRNIIAGGNEAHFEPACRMATMEWDDELSTMAGLNVEQCKLATDRCHNTDDYKFSGQNLASIQFDGKPNNFQFFQRVISSWYNENKNCIPGFIDSYPNNYRALTFARFTLMVAERNVRVGCAAAKFTANGQSHKTYLIVCNYATTNIVDHPIYETCRVPASGCSTGTNPLYPNLCSTSEIYDLNKWN